MIYDLSPLQAEAITDHRNVTNNVINTLASDYRSPLLGMSP